MIDINLGPGIAPDVTVDNSSIFLCYGHTDGRLLFETFQLFHFPTNPLSSSFADSRVAELQRTGPTQVIRPLGCSHAFPRLDGHWLTYRDETDFAVLRSLRDGSEVPLGKCGGNAPVAVRADYFAWRDYSLTFTTVKTTPYPTPAKFSDGISRIAANGFPIYMWEDFKREPGGTKPSYAGDLVVLEHPDGGVLCRLADGREIVLWPAQDTMTPRCAVLDAERFVVATWGIAGIRVGVINRNEFTTPGQEPPAPEPNPTARVKVDILEYSDTQIVIQEPSTDMEIIVDLVPTGTAHERDIHVSIETPRGKDRSGRTRKVRF